MLLTFGGIPLGAQYWMRWRNTDKLVLVSLLFVHGTQTKSRSSPNLGNCRRSHLWVRVRTTFSTPYLHPDRGLHTSMRVQVFLWAYLPVLGKECSAAPVHFLTILSITQCHADLDNHKNKLCYEKCPRLACIRFHPCARLCHEPCGKCGFPVSNVTLHCGHVEKEVLWYVWKPSFFNFLNVNLRRFQPPVRGFGVRQVPEKGLEEASVLRTFETTRLPQGPILRRLYRAMRPTHGLLFQEVQGKVWRMSEAELGRSQSSVRTDRACSPQRAPMRTRVVLPTLLRTSVPPQGSRMQQ